MGNTKSVCFAEFPAVNDKYLVENSIKYPISFNGKVRFTLEFPTDISREEIETKVLSHKDSERWLEGKSPKKVIIVPNKIVNIVV